MPKCKIKPENTDLIHKGNNKNNNYYNNNNSNTWNWIVLHKSERNVNKELCLGLNK